VYDEISIKNVNHRKTLSGFNPIDNEASIKSGFDLFIEWWRDIALGVLDKINKKEFVRLLNQTSCFGSVGELLVHPSEDQTNEMAAYLLVLTDRYGNNARTEGDPWIFIDLLHQIYECVDYIICKDNHALRINAQKAAYARHAEHRAMKEDAYLWFTEKGGNLTKDEAAIAITKQVPIKLRTAQDWVTQFRKKLRSAC
jgi:hypothetical protein